MKRKVKLNLLSVTVSHKNTNMFTFSDLRSGLLLYFRLKTIHCLLNIRIIFAARTFVTTQALRSSNE